MKLSNKILIGFFGFIFLYLTAVFAEIRLSGTPNIINDSNSIAETVDIPGVSYLVLHNFNKDVNVIGSAHPRIEIRSFSGDVLKSVKYDISGDTLTMSHSESDNAHPVKISVYVSKSALKGMTVDSAFAVVKGLEQNHLSISQHDGRIWMSDSRIGRISVDASDNSHLDISATGLDTLYAKIQASQVLISSPVKLIEGSMKENSFLRLNDIGTINFKKDDTSRLGLYQ